MSITDIDSGDQETFVPARDDPKLRRARILKNPTSSHWYGFDPVHGWDNPADIEEATQYLEGLSGLCRRSNEDASKIEELASYVRELGISERKAAELILTYNKPPFSKARVEYHIWAAYEYAYQPPGKRSLAQFPDADKRITVEGIPFTPTPYACIDPATIPQREWIYKPCYIAEYVSLTTAAGGAGKSALVRAECASIASGKPLLGIPPERKRVWYWNGEDPAEENARAFAALRIHYGLKESDLNGWLFTDSGRDTPIKIATMQRGDFKIARPVVAGLIETIKTHEIGVLVIDPFVTCHSVNENDNTMMNEVVDQWRAVAHETGCAIHLVHHTRKTNGEAATIEASRGASAVSSAARVRRAINTMSQSEADAAGIERAERYRYISADYRSTSFIPSGEAVAWYRFESANLGNGPCGDGDSIGVVTAVELADLNLRPGDEEAALERVRAGGPWRKMVHAGEAWIGRPIAEALGLEADNEAHRKRLKKIIEAWLASGLLEAVEGKDKHRNPATFIVAGTETEDVSDFD